MNVPAYKTDHFLLRPGSLIIVFWLCLFNLSGSEQSFAQKQSAVTEEAPFLRNRDLPAFTIRLLDSVTVINTHTIAAGKPTVFILFSPDCDHCAQLARQVKDSIDAFAGVNLYMVAPPMPLYDIKMFAHINGLAGLKQVVTGQDTDFFFGSFFRAETVPFLVLYDRNRKLFTVLRKVKHIEELLAEVRKIK